MGSKLIDRVEAAPLMIGGAEVGVRYTAWEDGRRLWWLRWSNAGKHRSALLAVQPRHDERSALDAEVQRVVFGRSPELLPRTAYDNCNYRSDPRQRAMRF